MTDTIAIRPADVNDAQELARLNAAFNGVYESPEVIKARLEDPARVEIPFIAFAGARAVGFAALRLAPCVLYADLHAELTELYVDPAWRRRGIARGLVALAEQVARERGATELVVLTGRDNAPAQALYRELGFEEGDLSLVKELGDQAKA